MNTLRIKNFGQIKDAKLSFGDLTVLVGPQATGKSIALQLLKLLLDSGQVQAEMALHGLDWSGGLPEFLDIYFGEGMRSLWHPNETSIEWGGKPVNLRRLARQKQTSTGESRIILRAHADESLFFIPAQRILTMREGWPRPFGDYRPGDPFAVRAFSERVRVLAEEEFGGTADVFPRQERLTAEFRNLIRTHIFGGFRLKVEKLRQKRLVLGEKDAEETLPFMVWSAGQREFVPMLLGMYWLMPASKPATRNGIKWVVLEELEMGLHPRAISLVMLLVFELMARGYRVCLSTHSPQILDALWALRHLRRHSHAKRNLLSIFGAREIPTMLNLAGMVLSKTVNVFYFDRETGRTTDISKLDPAAEESGESGWGGLSEFSGRANTVVARAVANTEREE